MLTAFGPIGRWKLGSAAGPDPEAARTRHYFIDPGYQRFRHHLWFLYVILGGLVC